MINWHPNTERPICNDFNDHILIVYSKSHDFFGELYYQAPNLDENGNEILRVDGTPKYPECVQNDEGYFQILWEDIDGWISSKDLKEYVLSSLNISDDKSDNIVDTNDDVKLESKYQKIEPPFDQNKTYNILCIKSEPYKSYIENCKVEYPSIYFYSDIKPTEIRPSIWGNHWELVFKLPTESWYSYNLELTTSINYLNKPNHLSSVAFLISADLSKQQMIKILLDDFINGFEQTIKQNIEENKQHQVFIDHCKQLLKDNNC